MPTPRTTFGKYEILAPLGAGGMGSVHLARDPSLDRLVAIKVLRGCALDDDARARFLREARATANLHHVNIITIYEVGEHGEQPFIAMEYVAGESLALIIGEQRSIPLATKLHCLEQICAGLQFAHRAGIVHRDVKPANLMVDVEGVIRILDFGIARMQGSGMTIDGSLIGTVNYMSPEQMLGRPVDHRSDVFAVGAVAYELIAYCQAFPGTLDALLQRLPHEPPPPLLAAGCPEVDPGVEAIIARALAKDPDCRFPDLSEMQAAVADARRRILASRGPAFVLPTPMATAALTSTLRRPVTRDPREDDELKAQLLAASRCIETGDYARALELARQVIDRTPGSVEAHALLVRAHRATAGVGGEAGSPRHRYPVTSRQRRRLVFTALLAGAGLAVIVSTAVMTGVLPMRHERPRIADTPSRSVLVTRATDPLARLTGSRPPTSRTASDSTSEQTARDVMSQIERTRRAALRAGASDLAHSRFSAAATAADIAERAFSGGEYAEAISAGATASRGYVDALAEAEKELERRRATAAAAVPAAAPAENLVPLLNTAADPAPPTGAVVETPPTVHTAPSSAPPEAATIVAEPLNPITRERPAILAALEQYRAAYRNRSIDALKTVYPELSGEELQARERAFKDKKSCRALDVQFGEPIVSLTADANVAYVNVMSTYVCAPVTGQAKSLAPLPDVFRMRKRGDAWVISVMGAMER